METQNLIATLDALITPRTSELANLNKIREFLDSKAEPQLAALQVKSDELDVTKAMLTDTQSQVRALEKSVSEKDETIVALQETIATLTPAEPIDVPIDPSPVEPIQP